jgi:hypothetical protein
MFIGGDEFTSFPFCQGEMDAVIGGVVSWMAGRVAGSSRVSMNIHSISEWD